MILIIDKHKRGRESVAEMFYYMGILAYGTTPMDGLSEISTAYSAVLITSPDSIPEIEEYVSRLRAYCSVPIFALCDEDRPSFDGCFRSSSYSSTVAMGIADYQRKNGLAVIGTYRLAGIDACADLPEIEYFRKKLPFTKTEAMILRYLIKAYPRAIPPKEILKYAFKPSRRPEVASVRTHISIMNKKFSAIAGKYLTFPGSEGGYLIATPEMLEKRRESAKA